MPQVLPTQLIPDEKEGKVLRVRFIQKEGKKLFDPVYLFDEGSTISWIPCGRKLTCSYPGIKFSYGPDTYYGEEVRPAAGLPRSDPCILGSYGRADINRIAQTIASQTTFSPVNVYISFSL